MARKLFRVILLKKIRLALRQTDFFKVLSGVLTEFYGRTVYAPRPIHL